MDDGWPSPKSCAELTGLWVPQKGDSEYLPTCWGPFLTWWPICRTMNHAQNNNNVGRCLTMDQWTDTKSWDHRDRSLADHGFPSFPTLFPHFSHTFPLKTSRFQQFQAQFSDIPGAWAAFIHSKPATKSSWKPWHPGFIIPRPHLSMRGATRNATKCYELPRSCGSRSVPTKMKNGEFSPQKKLALRPPCSHTSLRTAPYACPELAKISYGADDTGGLCRRCS